ncbi:MAG: hypothetical protein GXC75_02255 [Xanthomonadaceae bacterium]|nr:hypothetical protein [Xanthomonadaceae bacterium]
MTDNRGIPSLSVKPLFDLVQGTGGLVRLINCGDFLEAYKVDATFRMTQALNPLRVVGSDESGSLLQALFVLVVRWTK